MKSIQPILPHRTNRINATLKCLAILSIICIIPEIKGQDMVYPSGVINPFIFPENPSTEAESLYNNLNSKTVKERENLIDERIITSRVKTIPPSDGPPKWDCNDWTRLQIFNGYNWGRDIYRGDGLVFSNYQGFVIAEVLANEGTYADQGKDGIRWFGAEFRIPELNAAHIFCTAITGNNTLNGEDWYDTEPRDGITDVQPGELNVPLNTPEFNVSLPYVFKNSIHDKVFAYFRIISFEIVNGKKILIYNVNDDPRYNTRMRLITQREADPPTIVVWQGTDPDSLVATLTDENLKTVWYQVDGGDTLSLMDAVVQQVTEKKVAIRMNLPPGMHQITLGADDYFNLVTDTTLQREISAPSGTSPAPETEILQVYPNPVKDRLYLRYKPGNHTSVSRKLYDAQGILRYQDQIELSGKIICPIDMAGLPPGAYLLYQEIGKETRVMKVIRD